MFRRFADLHIRFLIIMEMEIEQLETKLHQLDKDDAKGGKNKHRLSSIAPKEGMDMEQAKLMNELRVKTKEYCNIVAVRFEEAVANRRKGCHYTNLSSFRVSSQQRNVNTMLSLTGSVSTLPSSEGKATSSTRLMI
jgi:hypothetical protein